MLEPITLTAGVYLSQMASADEVRSLTERALEDSARAILSSDGADCMVRGRDFRLDFISSAGEAWSGRMKLTVIFPASFSSSRERVVSSLAATLESRGAYDRSGYLRQIALSR